MEATTNIAIELLKSTQIFYTTQLEEDNLTDKRRDIIERKLKEIQDAIDRLESALKENHLDN